MSALNVLIDNVNKAFTDDEIRIFYAAAHDAETFLANNFELDYPIDVVMTSPSDLMNTIPEDGITGKTYHSRHIVVAIDTKQAPISQDVVFETICHEMSHSLRWEKLPEHATTLFKVMVLEGLAVVLEETALAETGRSNQQFFLSEMQSTTPEMIRTMIAHLKDSFDAKRFDYDTIFYTGDETLPRWAGYRLGRYFVKRHLETTGDSIYRATFASYREFRP